jgi:hypothetical protein
MLKNMILNVLRDEKRWENVDQTFKNKGSTSKGINKKQNRKYVSKNIGCNISVVG